MPFLTIICAGAYVWSTWRYGRVLNEV